MKFVPIKHSVRNGSLGRKMPFSHFLHSVGMQPHTGRIPDGMRMVEATFFPTERKSLTGYILKGIMCTCHRQPAKLSESKQRHFGGTDFSTSLEMTEMWVAMTKMWLEMTMES